MGSMCTSAVVAVLMVCSAVHVVNGVEDDYYVNNIENGKFVVVSSTQKPDHVFVCMCVHLSHNIK